MITKDYLGYLQMSDDTKRHAQAVYTSCYEGKLAEGSSKYRAQKEGILAIKKAYPEVAQERESSICLCVGIWETSPDCHVCDDQDGGCQWC